MTAETVGLILGVAGYEAVLAWPGVWWALIPWLLADLALIVWHLSRHNNKTACLFAYYFIRTCMGLGQWNV